MRKKLLVLIFGSTLLLTACGDESDSSVEEASIDDNTEEVAGESEGELPEEIQDLRITDVREDTTGNWKKVVDNKNFNMPENAVVYSDEYMNEDEIHFLVSFVTNTTTQINKYGEILYVDIYEYEKKEEHSAKSLGSGMLLKSYQVNKDTGEITELEEE